MKRNLLIASLLLTGAASAQFTQANEPAIGTSQSMYVCDTLTPNYAAMSGTGQTWDYSGAAGMSSTRLLSIQDASTTPEASNFPTATKAVVLEDFMTTYFNSTASSRNSQGFVFTDPGLGTISVVFDVDDELLMNYPFAYSNSLADAFSGYVDYDPLDPDCNGSVAASVDGSGTLILNGTTTLSNVVRYKLIDTASAETMIGDVQMKRTQFEYYDLANSALPVFVHATFELNVFGSPQTLIVVLNSVEPDQMLAVENKELENITVYPNPATETISVKGLENNATLTLVDATGKTVSTATAEPGAATMNIGNVTAGVYFLHVTSNNATSVQRVVIR